VSQSKRDDYADYRRAVRRKPSGDLRFPPNEPEASATDYFRAVIAPVKSNMPTPPEKGKNFQPFSSAHSATPRETIRFYPDERFAGNDRQKADAVQSFNTKGIVKFQTV
jgi:hypothetical protein